MDCLLDSAFMFELQNSVNWCPNSPTLLSSEGSMGERGFSQPNMPVINNNNIADVVTVAMSSPFTYDPIQEATGLKQQQYYYNNVDNFVHSSSSASSSSHHSSKNRDDLKYVSSKNSTLCPKLKKSKHVGGSDDQNRWRKRIRWTKELHKQFVECVNVLGGPKNATPKAILLMMGSDGLTILHVKSHLQKYRTTRSIQDDGHGKSDKTHHLFQKINPKLSNQINQALKMHMDVQKKLQDQLKIQRRLELQIEEQGKQLNQMLMQQYINPI